MDDQQQALDALESYKQCTPSSCCAPARRLGLGKADDGDRALCEDLLRLLAQGQVDHTIFWRRLSHAVANGDQAPVRDLSEPRGCRQLAGTPPGTRGWTGRGTNWPTHAPSQSQVRAAQPLGELAIRAAQSKDFSGVAQLLTLLRSPFDEHPGFESTPTSRPIGRTGRNRCSS